MVTTKAKPSPIAKNPMNHLILSGIIFLGILGFLIAATIVLSLIPIYLPNKSIDSYGGLDNINDTLYLQYESSASADTSLTGNGTNTDEIADRLNAEFGFTQNYLEVTDVLVQTQYSRRRRNERSIKTSVLYVCKIIFGQRCQAKGCLNRALKSIVNRISSTNTLSAIPHQITSRESNSLSAVLTVTLVRILFQMPDGFPGEPVPSRTFVAEKSGEFNDSSIWRNKILPYGAASIVISPNATVTITRNILDLNMTSCDVYGKLILGSPTSTNFSLLYPTKMSIFGGGVIQAAMPKGEFIFPKNTLILIYSNGSFIGNGSMITTSNQTRSLSNTDRQTSLSDNTKGPFTICSLTNGSTFTSNSVAFITKQSGDFSNPNTWYGSQVPSTTTCISGGNCTMNVIQNVTVSTASLNGIMPISFEKIIVYPGSKMEIGSSGLTTGFTFSSPVRLDIFGILSDVTNTTGGISLKLGSRFYFYSGSSFTSFVSNFLYIVNPVTERVRNTFRLDQTFAGPFFLSTYANGTVIVTQDVPAN